MTLKEAHEIQRKELMALRREMSALKKELIRMLKNRIMKKSSVSSAVKIKP